MGNVPSEESKKRKPMPKTPRNVGVDPTRRVVCSAMAQEGHGKTDFLLTFPTPILDLSVDPNTAAVVQKVFGEDPDPNDIRLVQIPYPIVGFQSDEQDVMNEAADGWDVLVTEISDVMHQRCKVMPKSVLIDSGTEIAELNMLREFGRTDRISPNMRRSKMGNLNNEFKGLFRALERAGVHVGITHRVREHWETITVRKPGGSEEKDVRVEGEFDRIGFKQMGNMCSVEVLMMFDPTREGRVGEKFGMRVLRSRDRPALVGKEFWGKVDHDGTAVRAPSFPFLAAQLFPGTTLGDWQ